MARILVTGAAGRMGTMLRPRLVANGHTLRLLDIAPMPDGAPSVATSITDLDAMVAACDGIDAIVHLGGQAHEAGAEEVLRLNAYGTYCVLEAARRNGITRVVLASSNHAAGFYARDEAPDGGLPADVPPRPDCLYGWSKAAVEAAGRLYVDRYGMDVLCLRIGLCFAHPREARGLSMWLSPDDAGRLVEASITAPSPGFRTLWGISRNTRRWLSLAEGEALGYHPEDDAEAYAHEIPEREHPPSTFTRVGGMWCDMALGEWPPRFGE